MKKKKKQKKKEMFRTDLVSITNVYQLKLSNGECTGLGDYIRGSLCLLQICNQFHIEFGMHMKNHPISTFLKSTLIDTPSPPKEIVKYTDNNYNPVSPFFLQHFIQFINHTTFGPHVYIHCISFPIHETKIPNTQISFLPCFVFIYVLNYSSCCRYFVSNSSVDKMSVKSDKIVFNLGRMSTVYLTFGW